MSADHSHAAETPSAHDHAAEIAHIKEHAFHNIFWFAGFFSLILVTVANYEFYGTENIWGIVILTAARCILIAFFLNWLFHGFSLVFRTFLMTIFCFGVMIFLSWWDSTLPHIGD